MKLQYRTALYLIAGGAFLTWIDLPAGFLIYALVIALVIGFAYLEALLFRPGFVRPNDPKVISLADFRSTRSRRQPTGAQGRERRTLHTVYTSAFHGDVEALLHMLRAEGMNPMMVSGVGSREESGLLYEVRLPAKEVEPAKPLILLFQMKYAKTTP